MALAVGVTVSLPAFADVNPSASSSSAQLKQNVNSCQTVATRNGLYVRSQPTVFSEALTILPAGTAVSVESTAADGWLRITDPIGGFVFGAFLRPCSAPQALAPTANQSCRQVAMENGLYVRRAPTVYSRAIAQLDYGQRVSTNDTGEQWVPITAPIDGYVFLVS